MSVIEIVGSSDRRSLIKRFERKSKHDAIRELVDWLEINWRRIEQLEGENKALTAQLAPAPDVRGMVGRFLSWPLPASVKPDGCVMDREHPHRYGTNLLTAEEAQAMFEHVLATPAAPQQAAMPILVEAVATVVADEEEGLRLSWLLEGGISALEQPGTVLLVAQGALTNDEGHGYVIPTSESGEA